MNWDDFQQALFIVAGDGIWAIAIGILALAVALAIVHIVLGTVKRQ